MRKPIAFLSAVAVMPLMFAAADAAAAVDAESPVVSSVARSAPGPWLVRAEGSFMDMRDNWLGIPGLEAGLTVGRYVVPRLSVELTASLRPVENAERRAWSALAAARWAAIATANGRHAMTIAAGPFVEVANKVHGTLPFARAELAYVYRAPFGLMVLAGGGLNFALASSPYVTPPETPCPPSSGDSFSFCLDFGPDAQEIHAGDPLAHMRLAVGWQF